MFRVGSQAVLLDELLTSATLAEAVIPLGNGWCAERSERSGYPKSRGAFYGALLWVFGEIYR